MDLTEATEEIRRLSAMPEPLSQQFEAKQYRKCVAGLEALAEQNILTAQIAVGHIYFFGGGGVRKNYTLARHWLEAVVDDRSCSYAAHRLGIIYYKGLGVPSDHTIAYKFFRNGGLRGHLKSLFMAAWMLKTGDGVVAKPHSSKTLLWGCVSNKKLGISTRALALAVAVGVL